MYNIAVEIEIPSTCERGKLTISTIKDFVLKANRGDLGGLYKYSEMWADNPRTYLLDIMSLSEDNARWQLDQLVNVVKATRFFSGIYAEITANLGRVEILPDSKLNEEKDTPAAGISGVG